MAAGAWLLAVGMVVAIGSAAALADTGTETGKDVDGPTTTQSETVGGTARGENTAPERDVPSTLSGGITTRITHDVSRAFGARDISADTVSTISSAAGLDAPSNEPEPTSDGDPTPPSEITPTGEVDLPPLWELTPSDTPSTDETPVPYDASAAAATETAQPTTPADHGSGSGSDPVPTGSDAVPTNPSVPPSSAPVPEVPIVEEVVPPTTAVTPPVPAEVPPVVVPAAVEAPLAMTDESSPWASAASSRPASSPLQILRLLSRTTGTSTMDGTSGIPTLLDGMGMTLLDSAQSVSGSTAATAGASSMVLPAYVDITPRLPAGLQTFLHSYGTVIVVMSLSAMLAAALPGLAGILIPTVAGVHIGYRQAKAVGALRSSGIAHLAVTGPVGVVRSGSLIALRTPKRRPQTPTIHDRVHEVA